MALVFAVFLLALLVVFARPEGRAHRIARLKAVLARAAAMARRVTMKGTDTVDRIAAELAEDHRGTGRPAKLLTPADEAGANRFEQHAQG